MSPRSDVHAKSACPVCFDYIVVLATEARLVFICPQCECAWDSPTEGKLDELRSFVEIAPAGVRLPNSSELQASDHGPFATIHDEFAWSVVQPLLCGADGWP